MDLSDPQVREEGRCVLRPAAHLVVVDQGAHAPPIAVLGFVVAVRVYVQLRGRRLHRLEPHEVIDGVLAVKPVVLRLRKECWRVVSRDVEHDLAEAAVVTSHRLVDKVCRIYQLRDKKCLESGRWYAWNR